MDFLKLIEKSEKYIHKDLKFSMREFKILKELKKEVEYIEQLLSRRARGERVEDLLKFYKSKARRAKIYSERIERRLNIWIKRLERALSDEELKLSIYDRKYFEKFKLYLDVCKNTLIRILSRGGELHDLIEKEDWQSVESKINEALGDTKHPGIRSLIALSNQLESLEEKLEARQTKKSLATPPVIKKQKLRVDMHFHPDFPSGYNDALNKSVKLWKELVSKGIDVIIITEHQYKKPARAYRLVYEGRAALIKDLVSKRNHIKSQISSSNSAKLQEKIKEITDYIFKIVNIVVFAGAELYTIEKADIVVFTEHKGYNPNEVNSQIAAFEKSFEQRGISPDDADKLFLNSLKKFIQLIESKCITDLYLEKRFENPATLIIPEVIDICKQRGFGVYMPHPYQMSGGVPLIGKRRLERLKQGITPEEQALLGEFLKIKTGRAAKNKEELMSLIKWALDSKKFDKELIELLGADGLASLINNRKIGISKFNDAFLPYFNILKKFRIKSKYLEKLIYTPQALIEKANPAFYGGGSDAHSIEGLGSALAINIGLNDGSKREIIYKSIINSKDPEISTGQTISSFNVDSKCVKDVIRAKWSSLKGGLRFGWGVAKHARVVGKEVYDYAVDDKKLGKLSQEKIEELIEKTKDPKTPIEDLLKIKKEINKPNVLLAMDDNQRKRYKEALKSRHLNK